MLSGLALAAGVTALLAGLSGAFSPCGFSVVETIGGALGDERRWVTLAACLVFGIGALIGGPVTFVGLAAVGSLIGDHSRGAAGWAGAAVALVGAVLDWRGVKIVPQIRRQVPERWRWIMPLPWPRPLRAPARAGLHDLCAQLRGLGFGRDLHRGRRPAARDRCRPRFRVRSGDSGLWIAPALCREGGAAAEGNTRSLASGSDYAGWMRLACSFVPFRWAQGSHRHSFFPRRPIR